MKRNTSYAVVLFLCVILFGCGQSKKSTNENTATDSIQIVDIHNAENALDYLGEYKGTIPAADCEGIIMELALRKNHTFTLKSIYLDGKQTTFNRLGKFEIEGNILTLTDEDGEVSYYKVEEGQLVMLNADKQPVTGELANAYVLKQEKAY